jgi:tetratricopeptide (TPR) repeat protein
MSIINLKQRDFVPYRKRKRARLIVAGVTLVLAVLFFLFLLPIIQKESDKTKTQEELLVQGYSKTRIIALWKQKDFKSILNLTSGYLKKYPIDSFALSFNGFSSFYLALQQAKNEDMLPYIDQSIISLRKALLDSNNPLKGELQYVLGKAYYHKGRYYSDSAVQYLETSLKSYKVNQDVYEYLGLSYAQMGKYAQSVEMFRKAMKYNSSDILMLTLAQSYIRLNDLSQAETQLQQAIEKTKDITIEEKSRFLLGDIYVKQKSYAKAIEEFESIIAKNASSADAYYNLGLIYQEMGDAVKARAVWRKAIRVDPMHSAARLRLYS